MILEIPITGKLTSFDSETKTGIGSDDNPVRPLDFNKLMPKGSCDFEWEAVLYTYEASTAAVLFKFGKLTTVTEWDTTKEPAEPLAWRRESDAELYARQAATEKLLRDTFEGRPAAELRKITGEPEVEMPDG